MGAMKLLTAVLLVCFAIVTHAGLGDLFKSAQDALQSDDASAGGKLGAGLTDSEIGSGLKQALEVGAERAVALLGKSGGYLDDPQVRIPLPGSLGTVAKGLRAVGYGGVVDEFETTVNRAAEEAIPQTLDIIKQTVTGMTLEDVRGILNGGDTAATEFLRKRAGGALHDAVLPIVGQATNQVGATAAYKGLTNQATKSLGGLVAIQSIDLDEYVTDKAMQGLYLKLAQEERNIRENPIARSTELLKQVFGD
jgi:hypothetical protein